MADSVIKLFDFSAGLISSGTNPLDFPENALQDGENVEITEKGIRVRKGTSIITDGTEVDGPITRLRQARFPTLDTQYLLAQTTVTHGEVDEDALVVLDDELPATAHDTGMTTLYRLGDASGQTGRPPAGNCSFATVLDRAIVTDGEASPPLVFLGCQTNDGTDWAHPKAVLLTRDGQHYEDITSDVCDPDSTTTADAGGILPFGGIYICTDVPTVSAFWVEMGTPNAGTTSYTSKITQLLDEDSDFTAEDRKGEIVSWVQDSGATGHFVGTPKTLTNAAAADLGGGSVSIPCAGHGFVVGDVIDIDGTSNYDATYTLPSQAAGDASHIVITATYNAETFAGTETAVQRMTLGAGKVCADVEAGMQVVYSAGDSVIMSITGDGEADGEVTLNESVTSKAVTAIYGMFVPTGESAVETGNVAKYLGYSTTFTQSYSVNSKRYSNYSLRVVVPASLISTSGTGNVRITTRSGAASCVCSHMSIGRQSSGANTTTTPTEILTNGQSGFSIGASTTLVHDVLENFPIDETASYIIIYDIPSQSYTGATTQTATVSNSAAVSEWESLTQNYSNPYPMYGASSSYTGSGYTTTVTANPSYTSAQSAYSSYSASKPTPSYEITQSVTTTTNAGSLMWSLQTGATIYVKAGATSYASSTVTGYTALSGQIAGVSLIEVSTGAANVVHAAQVFYTDDVDITSCEGILGTDTEYSAPADSQIYVGMSATGVGDDAVVSVFKSSAWRSVVRKSTVWQYKDAGGTWQAATTNTLLGAWRQAAAISANQMTPAAMDAITQAQWEGTGGVTIGTTATINFFGYMVAGSGHEIPYIESFSIEYEDLGYQAVEGWNGYVWEEGLGWTDNTGSLGASGTITYDSALDPPSYTAEYHVINEVPGYWYRIRTVTDAGTTIATIRYSAPVQPLSHIADGQPDVPMAFVYHDVTNNLVRDFSIEVADNTYSEFSIATVPLDTAGFIYVGYPEKFGQLDVSPWENNNQQSSVLIGQYWNGTMWAAAFLFDGTSVSGKTLSQKGKIIWPVSSYWKPCIPLDSRFPRAYWMRFSVTASLTANTAISEVRVYYQPAELKKYKFAQALNGRLVLGCRTDAPDQVDVSSQYREYCFNGPDSGSYKGNSVDAIRSMCVAWDNLWVGKKETWNQLDGQDPSTYRFRSVEASRHTPINSEVIIKAPADFGDGTRSALYYINHYGAWVASGLQVDQVWNSARGLGISSSVDWWNPKDIDNLHICKEILHIAAGQYLPDKNWLLWSVPMIEGEYCGPTALSRVDGQVYDRSNTEWGTYVPLWNGPAPPGATLDSVDIWVIPGLETADCKIKRIKKNGANWDITDVKTFTIPASADMPDLWTTYYTISVTGETVPDDGGEYYYGVYIPDVPIRLGATLFTISGDYEYLYTFDYSEASGDDFSGFTEGFEELEIRLTFSGLNITSYTGNAIFALNWCDPDDKEYGEGTWFNKDGCQAPAGATLSSVKLFVQYPDVPSIAVPGCKIKRFTKQGATWDVTDVETFTLPADGSAYGAPDWEPFEVSISSETVPLTGEHYYGVYIPTSSKYGVNMIYGGSQYYSYSGEATGDGVTMTAHYGMLQYQCKYEQTGDYTPTENTRLIAYDLNQKTWLPPMRFVKDENTSEVFGFACLELCYHTTGDAALYGGDYDGRIHRLFYDTTDQTDGTNDTDIEWSFETGWLSFGVPEMTKELRYLMLYGSADRDVNVEVWRNGEDSACVGGSFTMTDINSLSGARFAIEGRQGTVPFQFVKIKVSGTGPADIYGMSLGLRSERDLMP